MFGGPSLNKAVKGCKHITLMASLHRNTSQSADFQPRRDTGFTQPVSGTSTIHRNKISFWLAERGRCVMSPTSPSVSRLSRQCGIPNASQSSGPLRPVTEIDLLSICRCSYLTGNTCRPPRPFTRIGLLSICRWCSYLTGNTRRPPRPFTRIGLLFICKWCSFLTWIAPMCLHGLLRI
jgi:hypothetical protein